MPDPSTNYAWDLPNVGGDSGNWGALLNDILSNGADNIDGVLHTVSGVADAALARAGGTMTGELVTLTQIATRVDLGSVSGATALDFDAANAWTVTITGATTFSFTNVPAGTFLVPGLIKITNGGAWPITWPASVQWAGGSATLTESGTDLIQLQSLDGGTTFQGIIHRAFA